MRPVSLVLVPTLVLTVLLGTSPRPEAAATRGQAPAGAGVWPLVPRPPVVAGFSPPATRFGPGHRGVDLAGRVGQPVRTALAGRVRFAGTVAGRGVVVVDHGGSRTTYEPVTASVRVGEQVTAGERIGRLQLAASHCFPRSCLHWGLVVDGDYRDPLTLVAAGPVRLLPLVGPMGAAQARGWAWR